MKPTTSNRTQVPTPLRGQPDVDANQGLPAVATTYNVRGLNDESKLRHLLNYFHKNEKGKSVDSFIALQETYIEKPGKLPYIWRGNFFLTPGNRNSCGCITLLSSHLNVIQSRTIADRPHVLACQRAGENNVALVIANLYAPNPNSREKISFFEEIFEAVHELKETYNCYNTFILGDFNLIFQNHESKNRNFTP